MAYFLFNCHFIHIQLRESSFFHFLLFQSDKKEYFEAKMSLQKQMIKFINVARQHPSHFISVLQKQIAYFINDKQVPLNNQVIYETNQGKKAWLQALVVLKQQQPLPALQEHEGLNCSSRDHALDLVKNDMFGHTGSNGSAFSGRILKYCRKGHGSMAQLIGADFLYQNRNHAQMTIAGLIIDDGVCDRGHRKTIFNPAYQFIGCKSEIQGQKIITVFNITQNYLTPRTQHGFQSTESSFLNKQSIQNMQAPVQNFRNTSKSSINHSKIDDDRFCRTQFSQYRSPEKSFNQKNVYDSPSDKMSFTPTSNNFKNAGSKGSKMSTNSQNRKLREKKESSKTYYEEDSKVTQITTTLIYNDGTTQEKVDRHTVYLQQ